MARTLSALFAGLLFAAGLFLSGMANPAKVHGFLNVLGLKQGLSWTAKSGYWDPSLALVMGGALMVTLIAFQLTPKRSKPWFDYNFHLPANKDIDTKLVGGAALFGAGWGLAGYCPGPALASVLVGGYGVVLFMIAMLMGMWLAKNFLTK